MNTEKSFLALVFLIANGIVCAAETGTTVELPPVVDDYYDLIYKDFSRFTNKAVSFNVSPYMVGKMSELRGKTVDEIVPAPAYVLRSTESMAGISGLKVDTLSFNEPSLDDRSVRFTEFENLGFSLADGVYRGLNVTMLINKMPYFHNALEICWPKHNHCVLFDNSIPFIDSQVRELRAIEAEGPTLDVVYQNDLPEIPVTKPSGATRGLVSACYLNSQYSSSATFSRAARQVKKKNLLNQTLYSYTVGAISGRLSCNVKADASGCTMTASSTTESSGGNAYRGYSIACSKASVAPESGDRGKISSETGCAVSTPGVTAKFSLGVQGVGLNAEVVTLERVGSAQVNGIERYDTCIPIYYW